MKVTEVDLTDFIPDKDNANQGSLRGQKMIEESLQEDGAGRSVVIDEAGRVVAGNKTLEAAVNIGLQKAIVVETDGTELVVVKRKNWDIEDTEGAARRYAYRDNRSSELSLNWSPEQLLLDKEAGVDFSGLFYENEFDEITAEAKKEPPSDPGPQISRADELQEIWQTELGQIWQIGPHKIVCGDCTDKKVIEGITGGEKADCLFTDPPYGVKRDEGFEGFEGFGGFGTPIARKQYNGGWDEERPSQDTFDYFINITNEALIFGGNFFADILPKSTCWLVWDKLNTMPTFGDCELIWTNLSRKSVKKITFEYNGLIGKEGERFHAAQKPVGLISELIDSYVEGSLILDPFLGSGTTLIAAHQLNRTCFGIEFDPSCVAVCLERASGLGLTPVLVENINT